MGENICNAHIWYGINIENKFKISMTQQQQKTHFKIWQRSWIVIFSKEANEKIFSITNP